MTLWDDLKSWLSGGANAVSATGTALSILSQRAFWVRLGLAFAGFIGILFSMVMLFRRPIADVAGTAAKVAVI